MARGRGHRGHHGSRGHHHHHHHHHSGSGGGSFAAYRLPIELIPSSSPGCIVFPYDDENKCFKVTDYNSVQTQERASYHEIEALLKEINAPFIEWFEKYEEVAGGNGKYGWLCLLFLLLFPLVLFYLCWLSAKQQEARDKWDEAAGKAKLILQEQSRFWTERGLTWNVHQFFPQWLELLTGVGGNNLPNYGGSQIPGQGGIEMMTIHQQNYPGVGDGGNMMMPQNQSQGNQVMPMPQYHANTYQSHV